MTTLPRLLLATCFLSLTLTLAGCSETARIPPSPSDGGPDPAPTQTPPAGETK